MRRIGRLEDLLPATRYSPDARTARSVTWVRLLVGFEALPMLAIALLVGAGSVLLDAVLLVVSLVMVGGVLRLTFVRRRWSYAAILVVELLILLPALLGSIVGLIGAAGSGLWVFLLPFALVLASSTVSLTMLWSAPLHDHFEL